MGGKGSNVWANKRSEPWPWSKQSSQQGKRRKHEGRAAWRSSKRQGPSASDLVEKRMEHILVGASARNLNHLVELSSKHVSGVLCFNHVSKSCFVSEAGQIAWTIVFLLTKFNRKHSSTTGTSPSIPRFQEDLSDVCNKLRWGCFLGTAMMSPPPFRAPGLRTPLFDRVYSQNVRELNIWLNPFKRVLTTEAMRAISKWRSTRGTTIPLARYVLRRMCKHPITAVPNDKTYGSGLCTATDLAAVHSELLLCESYAEIPKHAFFELIRR